MKVSIIIPVYNTEKYLEECINSALNQTYQDIEIIAVDDGSTDNSPKILKKYSDKIRIITKKNGGTASALNAGINKATGDWIKWLSADDVLYPNAVEELILEAEKLQNKKNTILYSNHDRIDSNGKVIKQFIEQNCNDMNPFDVNVILLDHFIGNATTSLTTNVILTNVAPVLDPIGNQTVWLPNAGIVPSSQSTSPSKLEHWGGDDELFINSK